MDKTRSSLFKVLVIPFLLLLILTVGITGWMFIRAGQASIEELANQLMDETGRDICEKLAMRLEVPHQINQINHDLFKSGTLPINDQEAIAQHYLSQVLTYEDVVYVYGGNAEGGCVTARKFPGQKPRIHKTVDFKPGDLLVYEIQENGERIILPDKVDYFTSVVRPWFKESVEKRGPIWSSIYKDMTTLKSTTSAALPVFDDNGELLYVTSVDVVLFDHFSSLLGSLQISQSGEIFIMQRTGEFVSGSVGGLDNGEVIMAKDSPSAIVRAAEEHFQRHYKDLPPESGNLLYKLNIDDTLYYAQTTAYYDERGIDWLIFLLIPESDFMAKIDAMQDTTFLAILFALGLSIMAGVWVVRSVTTPIGELTTAANAVAQGQWDKLVHIERDDEIGLLATRFNQMARELKSSFDTLESRVEERTKELEQAKEEAVRANKAKSEFLANMSHELRSPLSAIISLSSVLQESKGIPEDDIQSIRTMYQAGAHLLSMINDILDMATAEANRFELNEEESVLHTILETVGSLSEMRSEYKAIDFVMDEVAPLPDLIVVDKQRLQQVLLNLTGNAIKFTEKGFVTLRVEQLDTSQLNGRNYSMLRFSVKDTGVGIRKEDLEEIFVEFKQVGSSELQSEGTGLGLAISRKIVRQMGSDIRVESNPGEGSTFSFKIEVRTL